MAYSAVGALALLTHILVNFNVLCGRSEEGDKPSFRAYRLFSFAVIAFYVAGRVVVSAGMSEFIPGRDFACHSVFTRADKAMYERKLALHEREAARV